MEGGFGEEDDNLIKKKTDLLMHYRKRWATVLDHGKYETWPNTKLLLISKSRLKSYNFVR